MVQQHVEGCKLPYHLAQIQSWKMITHQGGKPQLGNEQTEKMVGSQMCLINFSQTGDINVIVQKIIVLSFSKCVGKNSKLQNAINATTFSFKIHITPCLVRRGKGQWLKFFREERDIRTTFKLLGIEKGKDKRSFSFVWYNTKSKLNKGVCNITLSSVVLLVLD